FPDRGQAVKVTESQKMVSTVKRKDLEGKVLGTVEVVRSIEASYTETITALGDSGPISGQRKYHRAVATKDKDTRKLPYDGRALTWTVKDGKITLVAQDQPVLEEENLAGVRKEVGEPWPRPKVLLPAKPVKVGESWTVSGKALRAFVRVKGVRADGMKAT